MLVLQNKEAYFRAIKKEWKTDTTFDVFTAVKINFVG
jgi:hypothetical protein